jgi:hypothetical protein
VSYLQVQHELQRKTSAYPPTLLLDVASRGSSRHVAALRIGMCIDVASLGAEHGHTPVSVGGPGCSGGIIALADTGRYPALTSALLGAEALHRWPFADADSTSAPASYSGRFESRPCRLCGSDDGGGDSIFHLVTACSHATMQRFRAMLVPSVAGIVRSTWNDAMGALHCERRPLPCVEPHEFTALQALVDGGHGASDDDMHLITYWMLMATPWPRFMTQLPRSGAYQLPASAALGTVFDALSVPAWRLRKWAVNWARWADGRLRALAREWRAACGLHPLAVRPRWRSQRSRVTADDDGDPRASTLEDNDMMFVASDDEGEEEEEEEEDDESVWSGEGDATASLGTAGAEDGASVDEDAYLMARFGRSNTRDIGGAARRGSGASDDDERAGTRRLRWRTATNDPGHGPSERARTRHGYHLRLHPRARLPHPESQPLVAGSLDPAADADAELPA